MMTLIIITFLCALDHISLPDIKVYVTEADLSSNQLTFSWSPVDTDCSTIHYGISASNCGNCPTNTTHTTATCTGVPADGGECTFAVQPVACGSIAGDKSEKINVTLANTVHMQCTLRGANHCLFYSHAVDMCLSMPQSYFQFASLSYLSFC